jgi:uncharacterized membrane protein YgcG
MKRRFGLTLALALVLTLSVGCTSLSFGDAHAGAPPYDWVESYRAINPECDWGQTLVTEWEVNPGNYDIQVLGLEGSLNTSITGLGDPLCLGTNGMTCQYRQTWAGGPNTAWGRVELEADGGIVGLSAECLDHPPSAKPPVGAVRTDPGYKTPQSQVPDTPPSPDLPSDPEDPPPPPSSPGGDGGDGGAGGGSGGGSGGSGGSSG